MLVWDLREMHSREFSARMELVQLCLVKAMALVLAKGDAIVDDPSEFLELMQEVDRELTECRALNDAAPRVPVLSMRWLRFQIRHLRSQYSRDVAPVMASDRRLSLSAPLARPPGSRIALILKTLLSARTYDDLAEPEIERRSSSTTRPSTTVSIDVR
jgi:hypothetical protein